VNIPVHEMTADQQLWMKDLQAERVHGNACERAVGKFLPGEDF
jgi:hypothetical protein